MKDFILNTTGNRLTEKTFSISNLERNNLLIFVLLLFFSAACVGLMLYSGYQAGVILLVMLIGVPIMIGLIINLKFGVYSILLFAFLINPAKRFIGQVFKIDAPLGVVMDLMIVVILFGLFVKQVKERDWSFVKNPLTYFVIAWLLYNLFQVANPYAASRAAWLYTVRGFAGIMVMYFVFLYVVNEMETLEKIIFIWIVLALIGALWGFYQEKFGYFDWEMQSIIDEEKAGLYFINGHWRKFSYFSDPMIFGILMSYSAVLCFTLIPSTVSWLKKVLLLSVGLFMLNVMLYSGTRAAYVLPFAALIFYLCLNINKKIIALGIVIGFVGLILINMPTSDPTLRRFQSAFKPGKDASYQVREQNQEMIQPFILAHPIGGGLGSTGIWGQRFSPNSMLAKFPPDSGYVRIAVEAGWIGLLIYIGMFFIAFYVGVKNYRRVKNKKVKVYLGALMTVLYVLAVANFPQEAIGQYPTNLFLFLLLAAICNSDKIDAKLNNNDGAHSATRLG